MSFLIALAGNTHAACPAADKVGATDLYGLWRAEFDLPTTPGVTLLLERHTELADSVRGVLTRDGQRSWVAGDVDDGDFTLEESANGKNISATWLGDVVEGSCGREIRGRWSSETGAKPMQFVMRKIDH
jgi:hypothetical protein